MHGIVISLNRRDEAFGFRFTLRFGGRLPIICLVEGPQQVCELLTAILYTEHVLETAAQHVELCLVEERNCYGSFDVIHYPAVPFATGV